MHIDTSAVQIEAPFDSNDFPKSVLLNTEDDNHCGECHKPASEFPRFWYVSMVGAAMFKADIYCADCVPFSYNETLGYRVNTLTGEKA
jgi:hypothetical protein